MEVNPVSFTGYNSKLKTAWKKGLLPTVTKGIYGKVLTEDNISLEHIVPHSQGGKTTLNNLFLADAKENSKRGIKPIADFVSEKQLSEYLEQFVGVKAGGFNGDKYIKQILKKIEELGGLNH